MGVLEALAIGGLALSGVSAVAQARNAGAVQEQTQVAAQQNFAFRDEELTRRQGEVRDLGKEEKSDVVREADRQLGTMRVVAGDVMASDASMVRMLAEMGGTEGLDIGRIDATTERRVEELQASKRASQQEYVNIVSQSYQRERASILDATLGFAGSALQIGGNYYNNRTQTDILRNRRD